jgi:hypothetical protein
MATNETHLAASFGRFFAAVVAGSAASWGARKAVQAAFAGDSPAAIKTATAFANIGTFWLVAGITWVVLTKDG